MGGDVGRPVLDRPIEIPASKAHVHGRIAGPAYVTILPKWAAKIFVAGDLHGPKRFRKSLEDQAILPEERTAARWGRVWGLKNLKKPAVWKLSSGRSITISHCMSLRSLSRRLVLSAASGPGYGLGDGPRPPRDRHQLTGKAKKNMDRH
jgi:hypothetical protein